MWMLELLGGKLAVKSVAVLAVAINFVDGCGCGILQREGKGAEVVISGPATVSSGKSATFSIETGSLGPGKGCPEVANWDFQEEGEGEYAQISIPNPKSTQRSDGTCVVTVTAAHAFVGYASTHTNGKGIVNIEL